jgi:hypothetical protein
MSEVGRLPVRHVMKGAASGASIYQRLSHGGAQAGQLGLILPPGKLINIILPLQRTGKKPVCHTHSYIYTVYRGGGGAYLKFLISVT